ALGGIGGRGGLQLAGDDLERVGAHARKVGGAALEGRQCLVAKESGHGAHQLGRRRWILHQSLPAIRRNRSIAASEARRPIAARSTLRSSPLRNTASIPAHIAPHLSVPSTCQ